MMRYTCQACARGEHRFCAGKKIPPPGMFGGSECICDGDCANRPHGAGTDPELDAVLSAMKKMYDA